MGEELPPTELLEFNYSLGQLNIDNAVFSKDDVVKTEAIELVVFGFEAVPVGAL